MLQFAANTQHKIDFFNPITCKHLLMTREATPEQRRCQAVKSPVSSKVM